MSRITVVLPAVLSVAAWAQVTTTSRLDGTGTDTQGSAIPGAQPPAVMAATATNFQVVTDERGYWAIPSLPSGTYRVRFAHQGFKTGAVDNVKLDAGVPATVNVTLEVGALTDTIEVAAGAEIVQADT